MFEFNCINLSRMNQISWVTALKEEFSKQYYIKVIVNYISLTHILQYINSSFTVFVHGNDFHIKKLPHLASSSKWQ